MTAVEEAEQERPAIIGGMRALGLVLAALGVITLGLGFAIAGLIIGLLFLAAGALPIALGILGYQRLGRREREGLLFLVALFIWAVISGILQLLQGSAGGLTAPLGGLAAAVMLALAYRERETLLRWTAPRPADEVADGTLVAGLVAAQIALAFVPVVAGSLAGGAT
jgi:hypothetical protein